MASKRPARKCTLRRWAVALALGLMLSLSHGSAAPPARTLRVEAAFLVNFLRYTEWPATRDEAADPTYRIAVVGPARAAQAVRDVARAAGELHGRRLEVIHVEERQAMNGGSEEIERLRGSHLVFLQGATPGARASVLKAVAGTPVLTVGDTRDFARQGGMFGLVRVGQHLSFEANPDAIQSSGLMVSAKVLKLAHRIRHGGVR